MSIYVDDDKYKLPTDDKQSSFVCINKLPDDLVEFNKIDDDGNNVILPNDNKYKFIEYNDDIIFFEYNVILPNDVINICDE